MIEAEVLIADRHDPRLPNNPNHVGRILLAVNGGLQARDLMLSNVQLAHD